MERINKQKQFKKQQVMEKLNYYSEKVEIKKKEKQIVEKCKLEAQNED